MHQPNLKIELSDKISIDLIYVEGGSFLMGDDSSKYDNEKPAHKVVLNSLYVGKYQVTQNLWKAIMGQNPSALKGERRPVESISWNDTKRFIRKLNSITGRVFRLPTEAEWEYAARGGIYSQGYSYAGSDKLEQVGWYAKNSNDELHEVGLKLRNELGIYDLSGNLWEWCEDDYYHNYNGIPEDGSAFMGSRDRGWYRIIRGGSYLNAPAYCRPSTRSKSTPENRSRDIGFRLALSLNQEI